VQFALLSKPPSPCPTCKSSLTHPKHLHQPSPLSAIPHSRWPQGKAKERRGGRREREEEGEEGKEEEDGAHPLWEDAGELLHHVVVNLTGVGGEAPKVFFNLKAISLHEDSPTKLL
jgi:hypothetical protein